MVETKYALVTGASSGIGLEVTKELLRRGWYVYACARRTNPMEELRAEFGERCIPRKLDVSNHNDIIQLKLKLEQELPDQKLHLLYNNAGQSCTLPALDATDEAIENAFRVNVFGPINSCRELSPLIINAKGTIVFTGSLAGICPFPFGAIYSSTKAAIHQYARVLHVELSPLGVRVINVITGGVATDIADKRPLPESSIYNFPEGVKALHSRQKMSEKNQPMSPADYARETVNDIENVSVDPVDVYRGTMATVVRWLMLLVPYSLLEWGLRKKFKLDPVYAVLGKRQLQSQRQRQQQLENAIKHD
ncbi:unnamed protein product [Kluyveromyces dobzhanskii CBS 2104]|uniref:WGS project CCBQ000000000 data, contig 00015 n=1 Tax=Kluyveromyces dobzhanskii CBS 2104 TaxID=1427455 RepID=A0A0A8L8Y1_9SACH|nr:unnamed protein product [Kluyveromyces dobzhanskii CBS 2104]